MPGSVVPQKRKGTMGDKDGRPSKMARYIEKGLQLYHEQGYDTAAKSFRRALWRCKCNKTQYDQLVAHGIDVTTMESAVTACDCRDYRSSSQSQTGYRAAPVDRQQGYLGVYALDLDSFRQLLLKPCTCGSGQKQCPEKEHLAALDGLAATYTALQDLDQALDCASQMITLAPSRPDGYLRYAKALRVLKPSDRFSPAAMFKQCLHNVADSADSKHVQIVQKNLATLLRFDLISHLPLELQIQVISELSVRDLIVLRRVSKAWKTMLLSGLHYKTLDFVKGMNPPFKALTSLVHHSYQYTEELCIRHCSSLRLDTRKLAVLLDNLPLLKVVDLANPFPDWKGSTALSYEPSYLSRRNEALSRVHTLRLENVVDHNPPLAKQLLKAVAGSLTELHLIGIPAQATEIYVGVLPNLAALTRLKLVGPDVPAGAVREDARPPMLYMNSLMERTPSLKQLFIDRCRPRWVTLHDTGSRLQWEHLEVLIVGAHVSMGPQDTTARRAFPCLGPKLRVIDILSRDDAVSFGVLAHEPVLHDPDHPGQDGHDPKLDRLEVFRCRGSLDPRDIEWCITPAMESGTLHTLELSGDPIPDVPHPVDYFTHFGDTSKVRTLGLYDFRFDNAMSYRNPYTGRPFLDWLARFPGVESVSVYPQPFDGAPETIADLLARTGVDSAGANRVKTVYQDCLQGVQMDKVLVLAAAKGVNIVRTKAPYRPPVFPYPDLPGVEAENFVSRRERDF